MNKPAVRAIKKAGGITALATALGVTPQVVANWRRRGVSPRYVLAVERETGVPRYELHPVLYPQEAAA